MHEEIKRLWARTRLHVWPGNYYLISFHSDQSKQALMLAAETGSRFSALIKERDEVSVTVSEEIWLALAANLSPRGVAGPYHVMTLDINIELSVCGYFAPAAERLAEAGISVVPQCAYLKDHVLIQTEKIDQAVQALQALIESAGSGE